MRLSIPGIGQSGDTIVEVLVVLAILGFAFAVSAATANRNLSQSRTSEEHSQQVGSLDTQVEWLRGAQANNVTLPTTTAPFCMTDAKTVHTITGTSDTSCTQNTYYTSQIVCTPAAIPNECSYYTLKITWEGGGATGPQQEIYTYRIHPNTATVTGISLQSNPVSVRLNLPFFTPTSPSASDTDCSSGNPGQAVTQFNTILSGGNPVFTDSRPTTNTALFDQNVYANTNYTVTARLPAQYHTCSGSNQLSITPRSNQSNDLTMNIKPYAWAVNGNGYNNCSAAEPLFNDGFDRCTNSGTSMYAYRDVAVTYPGSPMPADNNNGKGKLVIVYGQHACCAVANYNFQLNFYKNGAPTPFATASLPDPSAQDIPVQAAPQDIMIPAGNGDVTVVWNNNNGSDPNLIIYSLQMYYE